MQPLDRKNLFWVTGKDHRPTIVGIHQLYECVTPVTLTLTMKEDMDFCDSLDLIYGKQMKRLYLWDWFDDVWDKMHNPSRNNPYLLSPEDALRDVVTDQHSLLYLVNKPYLIDRMKKDEQRRQLHLLEPQPYINPKEMFDVPLSLSERKIRRHR